MRRLLIAIALVGCSSKAPPQPAPANTAPPPGPPAVAVAPTPPAEPEREEPEDLRCSPRMESWPEGHHDRYLFQDEKTELSGYKNKAGAIVIKARFREAYPFGPGGIAAVSEPKVGLGYIDPTGKMIAKAHAMDNGPDYFQDGLARIIGKNKKIGYIDSTGKIVIPPQFDEAMPFCDGEADVEYFGRPVTIDKTGTFVKPN
jgi:hypothetical protein